MPPVIVAVAAAIGTAAGSIGLGTIVTGAVGSNIPALPHEEPDVAPPTPRMLEIEGQLLPLGESSNHLLTRDTDGNEHFCESATITFHEVSPEFLETLVGIPIFGGDKITKLGRITKAWLEASTVRIRGEVADSLRTKFHLLRQECGLCLKFNWAEPQRLETHTESRQYMVAPECVYVTLPEQAGFESNWVKFADPSVTFNDFYRWQFPHHMW